MDINAPDNEHGKEITGNNLKEDGDLPKINIQADSSLQNSISSSPSSSSPQELLVTEKGVVELLNRSPKELVLPDAQDPIASPLDFSPQFTPILQSPRIQASAPRPSGYDPNRIPASIFSKPSTPIEWSVASNDSLFSIHAGNTSFSRDQFSVMSTCKSGELPRLSGAHGGEIIRRVNFESGFKGDKDVVTPEAKTINIEKDQKNYSVGVSYRAGEAYKSTRSFQFPVLSGHEGEQMSFSDTDSRRHGGEQVLRPQPPRQVLHQYERSQNFETKPKYGVSNWLECFSCCCRP